MKTKTKRSLVRIGLVVASCIIFLAILLAIDKFHDKLATLTGCILREDNFFSGETWFSVIASSIVAIPGIFCGVFALWQTQKLHELESRYHRPSLGLYEAKLKVIWTHSRHYTRISKDCHRDKYEKWALDKKFVPETANLMNLSMDIDIKNGIEVTDMRLEQIEFIFQSERYQMTFESMDPEWEEYRISEPIYRDGRYMFRINWEVAPYILKDADGVSGKDIDKRFWDCIEQFTNFENRLDMNFLKLRTRMTIKVYYEYAPAEYERVIGSIFWRANDGEGRSNAEASRCTKSGIFTYCNEVNKEYAKIVKEKTENFEEDPYSKV